MSSQYASGETSQWHQWCAAISINSAFIMLKNPLLANYQSSSAWGRLPFFLIRLRSLCIETRDTGRAARAWQPFSG